jgi:hypothetical protein
MLTLTKVLPALISSGSFTGSFYGTSSYAKKALTASYAMNGGGGGSGTSGTSGATGTSGTSGNSGSSGTSGNSGTNGTSGNSGSSGTSGGGASLTTGSLYPITSSWSRKAVTASYLTTISQSLIPAKNNTYSLGTTTVRWKDLFVSTGSIYIGDVKLSTSGSTVLANSFPMVVVNTSSKQLEVPGLPIQLTSSYANKALTASYVTGVGVGSSGTSGAAGTSGTSGVGSPGTSGTAGSSGTSSTATLQTGSLAKQTILYNVTSGSQNVITGLNLSGNKWGIDIKEEWDAKSVTGDEYYNSCSLLLHLNGSNGSTTFTDNSPTPKTATSNNGAAISTAQSKFGGSSLLLDGTNDYVTIPSNSDFDLTGNYTIEFWAYSSNFGAGGYLHRGFYTTTSQTWAGLSFSIRGVGGIRFYFYATNNGNEQYVDVSAPSSNAWHHFAMVKSGTTGRVFIDGTLAGTINGLNTPAVSSQTLRIGVWDYNISSEYFNGYIDEIRITKGVARYTGNFTPQTSEFPNNTSVTQYATKYIGLIGGLNDKSVDYGVQKLSDSSLKVVKMSQTTTPFPSGSLSSSVDRVYVNVLNYTNVSVTSSYATNALTASYILGGGANGSSGTSGNNGTSGTSGTSSTAGSSGTSGQNGSSGSSGTSGNSGTSGSSGQSGTSATAGSSGTSGVGSPGTSGTAGSSGTSITASLQTGSIAKQIVLYNVVSGSQNVITGLNLSGNKWGIDIKEEWDYAVVPGDQYYNNVNLLLRLTGSNGSTTFVDNSSSPKTMTANGNAQISTAQTKFSGGSLYLDGNGDYLTTPNTTSLLLGTNDFTIECFLYLTQNGTTAVGETYAPLIQLGNYFSENSNSRVFYSFIYNVQAGNRLSFSTKGGNSFGAPDYYAVSSNAINIPLNTWVHVAVTRTSNQIKFWYNGSLVGTDSSVSWNSINLNVTPGANNNLYIGRMSGFSSVDGALWHFPGYLSNIRITNGVARYTGNFTPATSQFPTNVGSTQYATKYIGLIGGLNDKNVDYGVQKLSDSSLKVVKMSQTTTPFPSGSLSSSVDRVYVNVLNYTNVSVTSSYATNALTASYILGGGANGSSGTSGATGATGTSGTSGNSGSSGSSGTSGATGTSGTSGNSGTSGSSGANGTSGSSGATGVSGSSGTSGGGASLATGSAYPITSSWSRRAITASYALNASGGGSSLAVGQTFVSNGSQTVYTLSQTATNRDQILVVTNGVVQSRSGSNYTVSGTTLTLSDPVQSGGLIDVRFINAGQGSSGTSGANGTVQTGSIAKQTILYNVVSGSQNVITGLNLSGNKWGVDIKEEWDDVIIAGDQYYNSCSLLMHFNGANGSTTFTDNSPSPKTVTSNNGAAISTAQSKFGGGSGFFDGTDDYLSINYNSAFNFGTNSFTWETWIYPTNISGIDGIYATSGGSGANPKFVIHLNAGTPSIHYNNLTNGSDIYTTATSAVSINTWTHLAFVRNGSNWTWYINGNSAGSGTNNTNITFTSQPTYIGYGGESYFTPFNGYIDELRVTKGVARYTTNFTPQTSEFPNNASITQYATKYVGLIGGLNDRSVDYGVQKLSDTSLKVVKMTQTTSPFPSGSLSSSVDRVYVNVLDYNKVNVTSSYATNALTASYASNSAGGVTSGKVFAMTLLFS